MPTIDQYATTDAFIRLLLQGPPGVGKTTMACQFPGVWVLDCDIGLAGTLRWLKANGKTLPLGYDIIDRKDDGTPAMSDANNYRTDFRYDRLLKCANAAAAQPGVQTLVFDSCTKINEYIKNYVLRTNPTKTGALEMTSWGFIYNAWLSLVGAVTAAKVNSVFIFHERDVTNEDGAYIKTGLQVQGQFKDTAGALFTDVWRAETNNVGGPIAPKYIRQIRTMPDNRYQLKNSFGLPPVFEFDWKTIEEKLKGDTK